MAFISLAVYAAVCFFTTLGVFLTETGLILVALSTFAGDSIGPSSSYSFLIVLVTSYFSTLTADFLVVDAFFYFIPLPALAGIDKLAEREADIF